MADFELTMQDPPRMNERLNDATGLIGETILAVFDYDLLAGEMVIVTENRNWLVLDTETDGCGEHASIDVCRSLYYGRELTLADFVRPKPLFDAGCINHAVYAELKAAEDAKDAFEKERRARILRDELAKLEGPSA